MWRCNYSVKSWSTINKDRWSCANHNVIKWKESQTNNHLSWRNYSTELLRSELIKIELDNNIKDVQSYWNSMEQKLLTNRLTLINNTIEYNWLNLTFDSFKVKCKNLFLIWYYELRRSVHNELILITMAYKWPFLKCKLFDNEINCLKKVTFSI